MVLFLLLSAKTASWASPARGQKTLCKWAPIDDDDDDEVRVYGDMGWDGIGSLNAPMYLWSLFIFEFLCWSFQIQRNIVCCYATSILLICVLSTCIKSTYGDNNVTMVASVKSLPMRGTILKMRVKMMVMAMSMMVMMLTMILMPMMIRCWICKGMFGWSANDGQSRQELPPHVVSMYFHHRNTYNHHYKYKILTHKSQIQITNRITRHALKTYTVGVIYSVVALVCPRGEEQISGPSAVSKFKRPSKRW